MELVTKGRLIYPHLEIPVFYDFDKRLNEICFPTSNRLCVALITSGTGIIRINNHSRAFIAPVVFCFNEKDRPELVKEKGIKAKYVFFHPNYINSIFTFENIRDDSGQFLLTDIRDCHWLRAFLNRDERYGGQLNIGPNTALHLQHVFNNVSQELDVQRDGYWPCRVRSYLIEMLFILDNVFMNHDFAEEKTLYFEDDEINKIIQFINNNYSRNLTIDQLCRDFNINRTTLQDRFKKVTQLSVMSYLINTRINLATMMLYETMIPVTEICERVGFQSITHFSRMFKKHTGYAPLHYRQKYQVVTSG